MPSGRSDIHKDAKPFEKGDKRINRKGRPKKLPNLTELLANVLGEENKDGITAAEAILMRLRADASKGNIRAAQLILEHAYGKPKQQMDINTTGEQKLEVRVKITKDDLTSDPIE
jgi:hypothetical protein